MPHRRTVLKTSAALLAGSLLASRAEAAVFGDLTSNELDRDYDQQVWAPNATEVQQRYIKRSDEVLRQMPPLSLRYGPGKHQVLDIFVPKEVRNAPVFVIIHGGAWRLAMREAHYGPAPAFVAAKCLCVVVGFDCIPAISLSEMIDQVRHSLITIAARISAFGGDPQNIHLIGHSSGAHLAALMLVTEWGAPGCCATDLRSATLLSGIFDLYPVMLSSRGKYLSLSATEVVALSPIRHLDTLSGSAVIAWASEDSPEFKRQSSVFAAALGGMGRLDAMITVPNCNHFEMFEQLYEPSTLLMQATLARAR